MAKQTNLSRKQLEELEKKMRATQEGRQNLQQAQSNPRSYQQSMQQSVKQNQTMRTFYQNNPTAMPWVYDSKSDYLKSLGYENEGEYEDYGVKNRSNYKYFKDPKTYVETRQHNKIGQEQADKPLSDQEFITKKDLNKINNEKKEEEFNAYNYHQNIKTLTELYKAEPKALNQAELSVMRGQAPNLEEAQKQLVANNPKNYIKEDKVDTFVKTKTLNKLKSDKGIKGLTEFEGTTTKEQFKTDKDYKNHLFLNKDIEKLKKSDLLELKSAKDNGTKEVILNWNGKKVPMKVDEAIELGENGWKRLLFNTENKSWHENLKDRSIYTGKRALDALDVIGQGVKGYEETMRKNTDIELGKIVKPLENAFLNSKGEASFTQGVKNLTPLGLLDLKKDNSKKNTKMIENWKTAFGELKDIATDKRSLNLLDSKSQYNQIKTGLDGSWKSLNGYYTKHPEEIRTAYNALVDQGWGKNGATQTVGLGGDIVSGIIPSSAGKQVVVKGGKEVIKRNPLELLKGNTVKKQMARNEKILEDTLLSQAGNNVEAQKLAKNIVEEFKKTRQISKGNIETANDQVDDLILKQANESISPKMDEYWNIKEPTPNGRPVSWLNSAQERLKTMPKRKELENSYATQMNAFIENAAKQGITDETNLRRMWYAQNKNVDFDRANELSKKSIDELQEMMKQDGTTKAYGVNEDQFLNFPNGSPINVNPSRAYTNQVEKINEYQRMVDQSRIDKTVKQFNAKRDGEGAFRQQLLNDYLTPNQNAFNFVKQGAFGPITRNTGLLNSKPVKSITDPVKNFVADSKVGQKWQNLFSKTGQVDPRLVNAVYDNLGEGNYQTARAQKELKELTKGATQKDLQQLAYYLIRPDETLPELKQLGEFSGQKATLPKVFEDRIDKIKEFRKRSFDRDKPFVENLKELENYLPGVYKGNEKFLDKIFPDYLNKKYLDSHERKTNKDFIATMEKHKDKNLKAVQNAGNLLMKREADSIRFAQKEKLRAWTEDMQKQNPDLFKGRGNKYIDEILNPKRKNPRGAFLTGVKDAQDLWKVYTMNLVPATAARNLYGGMVNNNLDGVKFSDYVKAIGAGKRGVKLDDGTKISGDEFNELATRAGIDQTQMRYDAGMGDAFEGEFGKKNWLKALNPLDKNNFVAFEPMKKINNTTEQFLRNAHYVKGLRQYGRTGAKEAAADTRKVHFDYNPETSLTRFEQGLRDYVVPFYTFQRFNLPYQASRMTNNPTGMNTWANLVPRAFEPEGDENKQKPWFDEYMKEYANVGDNKYLPTNWNSVNDFKSWFNPMKKVADMSSPAIKGALDAFVMDDKSVSGFSMNGQRTVAGQELAKNVYDNHPTIANMLKLSEKENKDGTRTIQQDGRVMQVLNDIVPQKLNAENWIKAIEKSKGENGETNWREVFSNPKIMNQLHGLSPIEFDSKEKEGFYEDGINKRVNSQIDEAIRNGDLMENYNYDPSTAQGGYNPNAVQWYDVNKAYLSELDKRQQIQERIDQGQAENPYKGTARTESGQQDKFGTFKFVYSPAGNIVDVEIADNYFTRRGLNEWQQNHLAELQKMVDKGRQEEQRIQEWLNKPQPTLKELYEYNGVDWKSRFGRQ